MTQAELVLTCMHTTMCALAALFLSSARTACVGVVPLAIDLHFIGPKNACRVCFAKGVCACALGCALIDGLGVVLGDQMLTCRYTRPG